MSKDIKNLMERLDATVGSNSNDANGSNDDGTKISEIGLGKSKHPVFMPERYRRTLEELSYISDGIKVDENYFGN